MANKLLSKEEVSTKMWSILQKALDEAEVSEEDRARVTIQALDWLNKSLGGPGVVAAR